MSGGSGPGASRDSVSKASTPRLFKFGRSTLKTASSTKTKVKLFGVDLKNVLKGSSSVEPRYPQVPKFLNDTLSYIEEHSKPGLNFYKGTSQFKSKIHQARHSLNYGEALELQEPRIAAGLVKLFLKELPTHVLGSVMECKLEVGKANEERTRKIQNLYQRDVSDVNKAVFERLVLHMEIIGVDLTPLLRTSQKALLMLKPAMRPWSIEDELRVKEARLVRMHISVANARATEAKTSKTKKEQDLDILWEAQRNVTQLKRKLKHSVSLSAANIQEARAKLQERCEKVHARETSSKAAATNCAEVGPGSKGEVKCASSIPQLETLAMRCNEEPATNEAQRDVSAGKPLSRSDGERRCEAESLKQKFVDAKESGDNHAVTSNQNENMAPPALEPKHDRVPQPIPVSGFSVKQSEPAIQGGDGAEKFQINESSLTRNPTRDDSAVDKASSELRRQTEPWTPAGRMLLDDGELARLQREWKDVIREQVELLRMRDDMKRRIRDEQKQIKMIQMVRNHRSRLASTKPAYLVSEERMSTPQLGEALSRLVESNAKLTKDAQLLADKVFNERMGLVNLRVSSRQTLLS